MLPLKHSRRGTSMTMKKNRQRGQILIMTTLIAVPLFGMLGLVTDLGYMHYVKMTAQSAAEAAALSAMIDFHATTGGATYTCGGNVVCASNQTDCDTHITMPPANAIQNGCMYGQAHGFNSEHSLTYQTGIASTPPTAPGIGTPAYWVTFRAYKKVPQLFSAVLGNYTGLVVGRSTAALVTPSDCIYALNRTISGALSVSGTASLTTTCGVYVDSNNACAISANGTANISATEYDVVGGTCTPAPLTPTPNRVSPVSDPLAGLPAPATAPYSCDYRNYSAPPYSNPTLSPGVYCGGIHVGNNVYTFSAGTYIMVGGGLSTQSANSTVTGTGVTFYNTFDATHSYTGNSIASDSNVNLHAPTFGTYAAMLFFDDRNAPQGNPDNYGGCAQAVYEGVIYDANNGVTMYGCSGSTINANYTIIVADTVAVAGTTSFLDNYSSLPNSQSPLQQVMVVE
jgi:Putative Flp pilus-assembly TadE/G-like